MAFISGQSITYDDPFAIKSIDLSLNSLYSSKNISFNASNFGYDPEVPFVSGFIAQNTIDLR